MNTLDPNYDDGLVTTNGVKSVDLLDNWAKVWSAISDTLQASGKAGSTTTNNAGPTSVDNWTEVWPASDTQQVPGQPFSETSEKEDAYTNGDVLDELYTSLFESTEAEVAA